MSKNRNRAVKHRPKYGPQANVVVLKTKKKSEPRSPIDMTDHSLLMSLWRAHSSTVMNWDRAIYTGKRR